MSVDDEYDEVDIRYEKDRFDIVDDDGLYAMRIKGMIEVAVAKKYTLWLKTTEPVCIPDDFLTELKYTFAERYAGMKQGIRKDKKRGGLKKIQGEYVVTLDREPVNDGNSFLSLPMTHDGEEELELMVFGFERSK